MVYITAEIGINHGGNTELAKEMIYAAAESGANAVKFQLSDPNGFINNSYKDSSKLWDIFKKATLKRSDLLRLKSLSESLNIDFFATPLSIDDADFLIEEDMPVIKIASGDIDNIPLLEHIINKIQYKKTLIFLSTGATELSVVSSTMRLINNLKDRIVLLHCISEYPVNPEKINLMVIPEYEKRFKVKTGLSDHSYSTIIPGFAVILGASVIEKHFTISRKLKFPDNSMSMEPEEFAKMVKNVRLAEKSLGNGKKSITNMEKKTLFWGKRSCYATRDIKAGSILSKDMIAVLRPRVENTITSFDYMKLIGRKILVDKKKLEPFYYNEIQ